MLNKSPATVLIHPSQDSEFALNTLVKPVEDLTKRGFIRGHISLDWYSDTLVSKVNPSAIVIQYNSKMLDSLITNISRYKKAIPSCNICIVIDEQIELKVNSKEYKLLKLADSLLINTSNKDSSESFTKLGSLSDKTIYSSINMTNEDLLSAFLNTPDYFKPLDNISDSDGGVVVSSLSEMMNVPFGKNIILNCTDSEIGLAYFSGDCGLLKGSASCVINNGMYPVFNEIIDIPEELRKEINDTAKINDNDAFVEVKTLNGPLIYFSAELLSRVGYPDNSGNLSNDLFEFSNRCNIRRIPLYIKTNSYVKSNGLISAINPDDVFNKNDVIIDETGLINALARLELGMYKRNYVVRPPREGTYNEWLSLFDSSNPADQLTLSQKTLIVVDYLVDDDEKDLYATLESIRNQHLIDIETFIVNRKDMVVNGLKQGSIYKITDITDGDADRAIKEIISMANNEYDFITFPVVGDILASNAVGEAVLYMLNTDTDICYADEDSLIDGEHVNPRFKNGFDFEKLLAYNYMTGLVVYRTGESVLSDLDFKYGNSKFYHYHLAKTIEDVNCVGHIDKILTSVNDTAKRYEKDKDVTLNILKRLKRNAMVTDVTPNLRAIQYANCPGLNNAISVYILNDGDISALNKCITGLGDIHMDVNVILYADVKNQLETLVKKIIISKGGKLHSDYRGTYTEFYDIVSKAKENKILIISSVLNGHNGTFIKKMIDVSHNDRVGCVVPKIIDMSGNVVSFGATIKDEIAMMLNSGLPVYSAGYLNSNNTIHEVMAPSPEAFLIKKDILMKNSKPIDMYSGLIDGIMCKRGLDKVCVTVPDAILLNNVSTTEFYSVDSGPHNRDSYINRLISLNNVPTWPPYYINKDRKAILLINGTDKDYADYFKRGFKVYNLVVTDRPDFLMFNDPSFSFVGSFNIRDDRSAYVLSEYCSILGITEAVLFGLNGMLLEALPFISRLGLTVDYTPESTAEACCPRYFVDCDKTLLESGQCQTCIDAYGSFYGHVDIDGWRSVWGRFLTQTYNDYSEPAKMLVEAILKGDVNV